MVLSQINDLGENTAYPEVLDVLVSAGVVLEEELSTVSPEAVDEFVFRLDGVLDDVTNSLSPDVLEKYRRTLGLPARVGESVPTLETRRSEIVATESEMRSYLEVMQREFPFVKGFLLYGSRMSPSKIPSSDSDIDIAIVVEGEFSDGQMDDVNARLKAFAARNRSVSGWEVSLFYTSIVFGGDFDKFTGKFVWGFDPSSVKYVGGNLGVESESEANDSILRDLNSTKTLDERARRILEKSSRVVGSSLPENDKNEDVSDPKIGDVVEGVRDKLI